MKSIKLGDWEVLVGLVDEFKDGFTPDVLLPFQVHGNEIIPANWTTSIRPPADGLLVNPEQFGGIKTADCISLVLVTTGNALVIHVSRKTLIKGILDKVPQFINLSDITGVFIGPNICAKHFVFETEGPELTQFKQKFPDAYTVTVNESTDSNQLIHLNVRQALQHYLDLWHIKPEIIIEDTRCPYETADLPSYRKWLETARSKPWDHIITAVRKVKENAS